jgi:hypothetical protein
MLDFQIEFKQIRFSILKLKLPIIISFNYALNQTINLKIKGI